MAARDSDYAAFTWFPGDPALDEWLALYREVARRNGGEPDAGRRLLSWARQAGFTDVAASASGGASPPPRTAPGGPACGPSASSASGIADQAVAYGLATRDELTGSRGAWQRLGAADDGWFIVPHGEILCRA